MVEKETKLWVKFYVLTIFSLISLTQCLNWFTFSSVDPDKVGCGPQCQDGVDPPGYYGRHMTTGVVAWLLNWGSVFGMAFFPVQGLLVNRSHGLRNCVLLGGFLNLLGCVLRLVPSYLSVDGRHATLSFLWLHAGQICVSCAGPLFMGTVSHLSCLWFFENERATATAVASTANWFGSTVGFLLGPALVPTAASFVVLLQAELVMAAVPFFCALIYFPSFPSDPPSRAGAKLAISQGHVDAGQCALLQNPRELSDLGLPDEDNLSFQAGLRLALGNTSFLWCVLMAGTLSGVFSTYQGLLQTILKPAGYNDTVIGWFGFANSLAGNVGSVMAENFRVGRVADSLHQQLKKCIMVGLGLALVFMALVFLACPSFLFERPPLLFQVHKRHK